jgi:ABC-type sugar transport system ATPase subunit
MSDVTLKSLLKEYPGERGAPPFRAVKSIDLTIRQGEFMVFVGPSGCGKSTTLRMIAGLESITGGEVHIGDRCVNSVPPKNRDISMVFQSYALYPHKTVYGNMAFGLEMMGTPKAEVARRVEEVAESLGLNEMLQRKPSALSGGQRQRVALGRAIVRQPKVFLFDEPLKLFNEPENMFVAGFIGSPAMNFIAGHIRTHDEGLRFVEDNPTAGCLDFALNAERAARVADYVDKPIILGVRPESIINPDSVMPGTPTVELQSELQLSEPMGAETYFNLDTGANTFTARVNSDYTFPLKSQVRLALLTDAMHFFDPESELALKKPVKS